MDFESALYGSIKEVWPNVRVRRCAFHLVACVGRKIKEFFSVNHVHANPTTKKVFQLVAAIPYVEWSAPLVKVFLAEIGDIGAEEFKTATTYYHTAGKGERREAKRLREVAHKNHKACDRLVKYLNKNFLSEKSRNGYCTWGYKNEEDDYTNNSNESANHLLNSWIKKNTRTYRAAISTLYEFMGDWIEQPAESVRLFLLFFE